MYIDTLSRTQVPGADLNNIFSEGDSGPLPLSRTQVPGADLNNIFPEGDSGPPPILLPLSLKTKKKAQILFKKKNQLVQHIGLQDKWLHVYILSQTIAAKLWTVSHTKSVYMKQYITVLLTGLGLSLGAVLMY